MGFSVEFNKKGKKEETSLSLNLGIDSDGKFTAGYDDSIMSDSNLKVSVDRKDLEEFQKAMKEAGETRKKNKEIEKQRKHELKALKVQNNSK